MDGWTDILCNNNDHSVFDWNLFWIINSKNSQSFSWTIKALWSCYVFLRPRQDKSKGFLAEGNYQDLRPSLDKQYERPRPWPPVSEVHVHRALTMFGAVGRHGSSSSCKPFKTTTFSSVTKHVLKNHENYQNKNIWIFSSHFSHQKTVFERLIFPDFVDPSSFT